MTPIESAYRKFCRERFPLPTEEHVVDLEQRIGVALPEDFRAFLLEYNGGIFTEPDIVPTVEECPIDCLTFLRGIGATHPIAEIGRSRDLALFDDNDPPQIVPVGNTMMGDLILLVTHPEGRGAILLKTFDDQFLLAEGIERFFSLLHERS